MICLYGRNRNEFKKKANTSPEVFAFQLNITCSILFQISVSVQARAIIR